MFIENPDAFKSWLTSILEPLCDADPAALAKYVYALVKKDKPLEDLRDGMVDQLDVFLQHETKPFVDMLFKALESQEHLKMAEKMPPPPAEQQPALQPVPEEESMEQPANGVAEGEPSPPGARDLRASPPPAVAAPRHRVVVSRAPAPPRGPHHEQTLVKVLPLTELLEEPVDPPRRKDRRGDGPPQRDDRHRRRGRPWERPMRARRHPPPEHERRRPSRSPSPRPRYRNRSPPAMVVERSPSRSRSRSPVPLRERDHERERERLRMPREMERDRMSRDRDHRDRLSRSRDRDRSRERSRGTPSPHPDRLDLGDAYKRRCRDFDEKGYCMRGDLCQWDHGADPVVLEDAALTRVLIPPQPPVPEYNPLAPDIWCGAGFPPYPHPMPPAHMPHPPRELIPIPRVRHELPPPGPPMMPVPCHPPPPRKHFDYNRLGPARPPLPQHAANCSLEVKKVPRGLNDITHLNNHFGKFGKIVNIQVCFEGDPEGALITFSSPTEANVAHKSTEAVLNNRFIKVFWHNPEAREKEAANGQAPEPKKEPPRPVEKSKQVMEMHKRAQALLETQLQQQDEGVSRSLSRLQLAQSAKKPKTREEAQKEILDAELDMFTKQQEGQDVTELAKRIADLRRQMAAQFPSHLAARRPHARGGRFNTATRYTRGAAAAKTFGSNSVDHRPRALLVSGFEAEELDALVAHFSQFGEVAGKEANLAVPELVVQFKARAQAEQALLRGKNYNDRTLTITWVTNNKPVGGGAGHNGDVTESVKEPEAPSEPSEDSLLRFDEEEEDDTEDRSWRR